MSDTVPPAPRHTPHQTAATTSPRSVLAGLFTAHPASVGESYFGHMRFAFGFAGWLMLAAGAALTHAIVPALFETTASRIVTRLHARLSARH